MEEEIRCEKCKQVLDEKKAVYLKYIRKSDTYTDKPNEDGPEHDELFPFGVTCANDVLKNEGKLKANA